MRIMMDPLEIIDHIAELFYNHNCIIIPQFGGFIVNYEAARVNPVTHLITPSSKSIAFNQNLKINDGILADSLAKKKGIRYDEALTLLQEFSAFLKDHLDKKRSFEFKNIGTYYLNNEDKLIFIPYNSVNYLTQSYGLSPIKVKPIETLLSDSVFQGDRAPIKNPDAGGKKNLKRKAKPLWSALMVIGLLTSGGIFLAKETLFQDQVQTGSMIPSAFDTSTVFDNIEEDNSDTELVISQVLETVSETPEPVKEITAPKEIQPTTDSTYFIVAGAFSDDSNSEKLKSELITKGYSSEIIDKTPKGLTRVSFARFLNREKAEQKLEEIKNKENKNAWILAK